MRKLQELKLSATFLSTWIIDAAISRQCTTSSDLSKLYDTSSSSKPSKSRESPDDHRRLKFFLHFVDAASFDTTADSN